MRSLLFVLPFVALTFLCWGVYGPVLHEGQYAFGGGKPSSMRPFICVGIAYFLIAVVVPLIALFSKGEQGRWTLSGFLWSFAAGAAGAVGALGITMAFRARGNPVYVMPLVFGCAPVVNTFCTMFMSRTWHAASKMFMAGVFVVAIGAAGVMFFKPAKSNIQIEDSNGITVTETNNITKEKTIAEAASLSALESDNPKAFAKYMRYKPLALIEWLQVMLALGVTALCWGCYGPMLHAGQMRMSGSRLRPFLCVGLAYFAVAVMVPTSLLVTGSVEEPVTSHLGEFWMGSIWSLSAGGVGAVGALGIILAFNFGGKPIFVMPLVFGGAPVINTIATVVHEGTFDQISTKFLVCLGLVIAGAATVLVFAPKASSHSPSRQSSSAESSKRRRLKTEISEQADEDAALLRGFERNHEDPDAGEASAGPPESELKTPANAPREEP